MATATRSGGGASEPAPMFNVTSRFAEAVELIHGVAAAKFPLVLVRIIKKLHLKAERIFSDAEEEQLQAMLGLSPSNLHTVLEVCAYVFEQAAYHSVGVEKLGAELTEAGIKDAHGDAFKRVWGTEGGGFVEKLRARSLGGPYVLSSSKWQMGLQMGSTGAARAQETGALFEFSLSHPDDVARAATSSSGGDSVAGPEPREKFFVEFSHDQLFRFFEKLERVQEQLDALS